MRRLLLWLCGSGLLHVAPVFAQTQPSPPVRHEEKVEVVAVTPVHGTGVTRDKIPANVQIFKGSLRSGAVAGVPALLERRAASVHISEAQGSTFEPDVLYRGFTSSPLLGAPQGIAVYIDGVRLNEPFGDTVAWDAIPGSAIGSINLMPGSNPLFGLNALGGALSIRTKDGFSAAGPSASITAGAFGRRQVEASSGGRRGRFGYFIAGSALHEDGWRQFSPSTLGSVFGSIEWRDPRSSFKISTLAAGSRLSGNGSAPLELLEAERDAVFTHPDRTRRRVLQTTLEARRHASENTILQAVSYVRRTGIHSFNGDAADEDDEKEEEEEFDAVNNIGDTRATGGGVTAQITRIAPLLRRSNHFVVGANVEAASTAFDFAAERAYLTADRGTLGTGRFDEDAAVDLRARTATLSAFMSDTWSVTEALAVTGSLRWNWTAARLDDRLGTALNGDHRFTSINPALGATLQVNRAVNLYGGYAQSSRVPTPVELTCADPEDPCRLPNAFVSDPPLEQVSARSFEAGLRGTTRSVEWSAGAFSTTLRNDIIFVSSGTLRGEGHFENIAATHRHGIELNIAATTPLVQGFATYTWQHATFGTALEVASPHHPRRSAFGAIAVAPGHFIPGVPVHSGKAGVTVAAHRRVSVTATVRARSQTFVRGDEANLLGGVPGFTVTSAQSRYMFSRRIAVVAEVDNLFNVKAYTFGTLGDATLVGNRLARFYSPIAPRAVWMGAQVSF